MDLTFDRPPLNEVSLGYTFLPRTDLLIPHLGRFWGEIADHYPNCQHAAPIIDNPGDQPGVLEWPLPRIWLLNESTGFLIQLQQDRFYCNWRDIGTGAPYVRFAAIRAEFDRVDALFRAYVERATGVAIKQMAYALTYVNLLKSGDGWTDVSDLPRVFPDLAWNRGDRFLPLPSHLAWNAEFPLPVGFGTLKASVLPAKLKADGRPILKFELTANSGSLGGRELEFSRWVETAHHWIVHAFKDLTGSEMHNDHWALRPGGG
jgi:hypothetical protein